MKTGAVLKACSRVFSIAIGLGAIASCSLFATRPVQIMSDTQAALKAAKEAQADTLTPDLYRQAGDWFVKARNEYQFKNFALAQEYANKARIYAEQAEFESIRVGAVKATSETPPEQSAPQPPQPVAEPSPTPYAYPTPTGTPVDVYEERKAQEVPPPPAPDVNTQQPLLAPTGTPAATVPVAQPTQNTPTK